MSLRKKKTKTPAKKKAKSPAKKVTSRSGKAAKRPAKKKKPLVQRKKTKSPLRKKATSSLKRKTKNPVRKKIAATVIRKTKSAAEVPAIPEEIKHPEEQHPIPVYNEMHPDRMEENKKLEQQLEKRVDVAMRQENQKVKSAMGNRQGSNRIFRTHRHK